MQDNSEQQYLTNPMDSPPELSQSSYSYMTYMGFEGDADVRRTASHFVALPASSSNEHNALPSFTPAEWKPAGGQAPFSFNPVNSGEWVHYESQANHPDGNNSTLHHTLGFVGDGQDTFMQPLAFHGIDPLVFNGLDSSLWDFPSSDLNGVATSAAIIFSSPLGLDNGDAPGFQNHPGQNVWDQPLARSDVATESLPSWDLHTTGTSIAIGLSSLGLDSASASGLQSYGSQNLWDQTLSQNEAVAVSSWGKSVIGPLFNGAFRPSNVDGGVIHAGVGFPMPWPTNTNVEGDFQQGVGSNLVAPSTLWDDGNIIWQPAFATAFPSQQNPGPNQPLSANLPGPQPSAPAPAPVLAATNAAVPTPRFQCTMCTRPFRRDFERTRHEASVNGINRRLHLCPVPGCPKSHGNGFSRTDKVTEHLWRKHANLGYTRAG